MGLKIYHNPNCGTSRNTPAPIEANDARFSWPATDNQHEHTYESVLTCPQCGFEKRETMPTDFCQSYYECANCKAILRPKAGDCCVYCSHGSVKCPPQQNEYGCCG